MSTFGEKCVIQWTSISQPTNTWCYKTMNRCKIQSARKTMNFQVTRNEKHIDMVSDLTMQLPFKILVVNSGVESKNTHNHLKKLWKYSLFNQYQYNVKFSSYISTMITYCKIECRSGYDNWAVFYSSTHKGLPKICKATLFAKDVFEKLFFIKTVLMSTSVIYCYPQTNL